MTSLDRNDDPARRPYQADDRLDRTDIPGETEGDDYARGLRDGEKIETGDRGDYARGLDAESPTADPDFARGQREHPRDDVPTDDVQRGDYARGLRETDDTREHEM